ncbi:cation:proton antiporter [Sphingomonas chungangi]|uniref:cation:proton antiporter n=1 Tax=Sphingomonas chungangi TaxID=2683589 RepID=UPI001FE7B439|nr:sodium:proton antiporter [Sphingomonas chungangi]
MEGMLSFLLFAGALHVDWGDMRRGRWPILILSTIGVLLSTFLVGAGFYVLVQALGLPLPFIWCLLFGALISPTDPIAVMDVLRRTSVDPTLRATVAGESLFNDGVGVVIFTIILAIASGGEEISAGHAAGLFGIEAGGGVLLGLLAGWIGYRGMRSIDDYKVEVMISLAVVMGGYAVASWIGVSGPVAMAVAGLVIGNQGVAHAMSEETEDYLMKFWGLIDEILNSVLFLLIGLEVVSIPHDVRLAVVGVAAIPLVLTARAISVLLPLGAMRPWLSLGHLAPPTLIWGGLRGGISVALALALPDGSARAVALAATYIVVLFAVIVQGSSIAGLLKRVAARGQSRTQPT